jgi:hypothetical protein
MIKEAARKHADAITYVCKDASYMRRGFGPAVWLADKLGPQLTWITARAIAGAAARPDREHSIFSLLTFVADAASPRC